MSENAGSPETPRDPEGRADEGASTMSSSAAHGPDAGVAADATPEATATQPTAPTVPAPPIVDTLRVPAGNQPPAFPDYGHGSFGQPAAAVPQGDERARRADAPRRRGGVAVVAALAVGALIGGASGAGISVWALSQNSPSAPATASSPTTITVKNANEANLITAIAAKASPSVVTLSVSGGAGGGTGSGVILSSDGYILTNTHVVTLDGSTGTASIRVTDSAGNTYSAKLVGTDPVVDLAVVKLDNASGLTPIEFGDSSGLSVGDTVVAIGAPLGLSGTVTNGIVSALNRGITIASSAAPDDGTNSNPNDGNGFRFDIPGQDQAQQKSTISLSVIQTDAAINPGNSGGALVDDEGKLVGINVAILGTGSSESSQAGSIGLGFSIPSDLAKRVADEIIADGTASHGLLGASVGAAPTTTEGTNTPAGAYVSGVTAGGAAEKAGLAKGDIVTRFNGVGLANATDLTAQVRALPGGSTADLTYVRNGQSHTVTVTLGELGSN